MTALDPRRHGPDLKAAGGTLLVLALCCSGAGCSSEEQESPDKGVEDLTITVEADKSRILQEEQSLQAKRETFQQERERLEKERQEVEQRLASLSKKDKKQREELEAQQLRLAEDDKRIRDRARAFETERAKLEEDKNKLLERIAKMTATKGGLTIEQREQVIAQREKGVAEREKAVAEREAKVAARESEAGRRLTDLSKAMADLQASGGTKTIVMQAPAPAAPAPAAPTAATPTKASVQKAQKQVRAEMDTKGILVEDLPPAARNLYQAANKAIDDKDYASAAESFTELEAAVAAIQINGEFVKAKMGRINRDVEKKAPDEAARKQIQALLADVGEAMNDGRYDRANKKINQIVALLAQK